MVLLSLTGCSLAQSAGSCVAPQATATPTTRSPSDTVTVSGEYWQPCNDTNHSSEQPWPAVTVEWEQSGSRLTLGEIAIAAGSFSGQIQVPAEATPGDATLRISGQDYDVGIPVTITPP